MNKNTKALVISWAALAFVAALLVFTFEHIL